jgi:hypothetical protein
MNENVTDAAIAVMDSISKHPIANDFLEPPGEDGEASDSSAEPRDFSTILSQLKEHQYPSIQNWLQDVEAIWAHAETTAGLGSPQSAVVNECRRLFDKYRRKIDVLTLNAWCSEIYRLRTRIADLMGQPPARLKQTGSGQGAASTMKPTFPPFSDKELQNFVSATELMTRDEDQAELLRILDDTHPELDTGGTDFLVDVSKISTQTAYAMRDYIRTSLDKRGIKYPD